MLVVLDSNILISALISPHGAPHRIYETWREGRFVLVTCQEQLEELRRASRYPKLRAIVSANTFGLMLNYLQQTKIIEKIPRKYNADDPHDAYLLNLANAAQAHYLVTGDKRAGLLERKRIGGARIVTAAGFCEMALQE
jgi:uncharacterized protein